MNKKALIFLVLTVISFFVTLYLNFNKIHVPYYGGFYKQIQVDVVFEKEPPRVFYNDEESKAFMKIDGTHYLFNSPKIDLVKKIKFENYKNIKKLIIYDNYDASFYDEAKEEIDISNAKSFFDRMALSILSFFSNAKTYAISYIFLFFFLYNFQFQNKKTKFAVISMLLLSLILRLLQLNNVPFFDDEIYVISHSNNWLDAFRDPGNPPLYFILFKIYKMIVQNPNFYRLSSVILGVLFNYCFYIYIKHFLGKKIGLIGLFLVAINLVLIYFSQEIRCYMLLMLLAVINSYFLFKFNNKNKFGYLISIIALLNTHFYGAFYVLYNFIFGLSVFKNKAKIKSFVLVNLLAFFSFLPVIIYKKAALTSNFNGWIPLPIGESYISTIKVLFGSVFALILLFAIILIIYFKTTKRNRLFVKYNYFAILFVALCAIAFSYLIKPIYHFKYFYIVFPSALALVTFVYGYLLKKRFGLILIFILFFALNYKFSTHNLYCNHSLFMDYVLHDIDKTKNNYVFATDTVEGYKDFEVDGAKMIYVAVNQGIDVLDSRKYDIKKPAVIYFLNFYLDEYYAKTAKRIQIYKAPLGIFGKIEL